MEDWMPKFRFMEPTQAYGDRARAELDRGEYGKALGTAVRASAGNMADQVGTFFSFYPKMVASALGGVVEGATEPLPAPAAVAKPVPPLPVGTFDAPVAPQTFRNPTARAAQTPLMQRAPNAPSYTLDDFMRETAGMTNRQLEQLYKTLPGRPKPPTAKEQAGNTLFNMIQNDFAGGLQAATTDDEKRAVYDRTQRALQGMYGVDPFTAYMMQQGAMPEE